MADGLSQSDDAPLDIQRVAIVGVDAPGRSATGGTRIQTTVTIDTSFAVGGMLVTPAIGEQWYVQRIENIWRLHSRLPFNDKKLLTDAVEGQVAIGSSGPLDLFGSVVNVESDLSVSGKLALNGVEIRAGQGGLEQKPDGDEEWKPIGAVSSTDDVPEGEHNKYFTPERAAEYVPVQSVNDHTGHVVIDAESIGLGNVNNTADVDKPISEAVAAALAGKATAEQLSQIAAQLNNITNTQIPNIFSVFGAGSSQTDWTNGWNNLLAMLGLSSEGISENPNTFDPFAAVQNWLNTIILPQGGIARLDDAGKLVGEQAPSIIDEIFEAWGLDSKDPLGLGKLWNSILALFGITNQSDIETDDPDTGEIWRGIINGLIKPRGLLAYLVDGKLPDGQSPNLLLNLLVAVLDVLKAGWDSLFGSALYAGSFDDAWAALTAALSWSSPPTTNMPELGTKVAANILGGIWQPLGDYLTELPAWLAGLDAKFKKLSDAVWDYLLGGNRYATGVTQTAWSKPAGAVLESAWKDFWAHITGQPASSAPTPGSAGASSLWSGVSNNFLMSITNPIGGFFDSVRRKINQMIEGLHLGYFNVNWVWIPSITIPDAELPDSGDPALTPGRNDGGSDGMSSHADDSIPPAPTGVVAVPWWNPLVANFPAGSVTYAVAAVKGGIEGPATMVTVFVGAALFSTSATAHVSIYLNKVADTTYRIYRKVDDRYQAAVDWRLITPSEGNGTLLTPFQDKTARTGGGVGRPKTDAELSAQIVTAVKGDHEELVQTIIDTGSPDGESPVSPDPGQPYTKIQEAQVVLSSWPGSNVAGLFDMSASGVMQQTLDQLASGLSLSNVQDATPEQTGKMANTITTLAAQGYNYGTQWFDSQVFQPSWLSGDYVVDMNCTTSVSTTAIYMQGSTRQSMLGLIRPTVSGFRDYVDVCTSIRSSGVTDIRVNLYKLSVSPNTWNFLWTSGNVYTDWTVASAPAPGDPIPYAFKRYSIPGGVVTNVADVLLIEIVKNNGASAGDFVFTIGHRALRNTNWVFSVGYNRGIVVGSPAPPAVPASFAFSGQAVSTDYAPIVAMGWSHGRDPSFAPDTQQFPPVGVDTPGSYTWTPPYWWRKGTDFVDVVIVGSGGSGGDGDAGKTGGVTRVTLPGPPGGYLEAPGGIGGASGLANVSESAGKSPGNYPYNGVLYQGGGIAEIINGWSSPAKSPGGGSTGSYFAGFRGRGGNAGVWRSGGNYQPNVDTISVLIGAGGVGNGKTAGKTFAGGSGRVWIIARNNTAVGRE